MFSVGSSRKERRGTINLVQYKKKKALPLYDNFSLGTLFFPFAEFALAVSNTPQKRQAIPANQPMLQTLELPGLLQPSFLYCAAREVQTIWKLEVTGDLGQFHS